MKKSILVAVVLAIGAALWVVSGEWQNGDADAAPQPASVAAEDAATEEEPFLVRVETVVAQPRTREITVRGSTEASRWVDVRSETDGRVVAIEAPRGATVRRGDVLAELSMDNREARLAEAIADVRQRELEYRASERLGDKGYRAETQVAAAAAALEAALARQAQIELEIENTKITAPFDGVLENSYVEIGDYVTRNMAVARVVDQDPYLVVGDVSEADVPYLRVGDAAVATLASGETVAGKVRFIATTADPKTRTFRVEIEVPNPDRTLRAGLTAEIAVAVDQRMAHLVSSAALTLNDAGELGVRAVDASNTVHFHPVQIVGDTGEGVWLTGLPERLDIITVGQEFVSEGDKVAVKRGFAEAGS